MQCARVGKEDVKYSLRGVKTIPSLNAGSRLEFEVVNNQAGVSTAEELGLT